MITFQVPISYGIIEKSTQFLSVLRQSNPSGRRDSVSTGYPNTEKRVENLTGSGVFLTKFKMFG